MEQIQEKTVKRISYYFLQKKYSTLLEGVAKAPIALIIIVAVIELLAHSFNVRISTEGPFCQYSGIALILLSAVLCGIKFFAEYSAKYEDHKKMTTITIYASLVTGLLLLFISTYYL